jgi:methionine-gamma-lyase
MEGTESAHCSGSGMGSISSVLLQLCSAGNHIVSSRTIYGGTYALMKNLLPRFNINTTFVNSNDLTAVEAAITPETKVLYCETLSNPMLEVADIPKLSAIAKKHNLTLVVDNTLTPLIFSPIKLGADLVVHSLTKFINGTSDAVGGTVCGSKELISSMMDVNSGTSMLLGPVLDGMRSASMLKNLHSLPVRMDRHSRNALYLAKKFEAMGLPVRYPGLESHPQHELYKKFMHEDFGYGGMMTIDFKTIDNANQLMENMQNQNLGYLAVSLGFYKTLFSAPGTSTSSEIPEDEQADMGLSPGIVRFSIGLDQDIESTFQKMKKCIEEVLEPVS